MYLNKRESKAEARLESSLLHFGTVKRKKDLLADVNIAPGTLTRAVKRFGDPVPDRLLLLDEYASDFFDFLLDEERYERFPEKLLRDSVFAYLAHEIWLVKLASRHVIDSSCLIAMDLRKILKDAVTQVAKIAGHEAKHCKNELLDTDFFRTKVIEVFEEVAESRLTDGIEETKILSDSKPDKKQLPES